jgi:hypothetical protein
VLCANYATLEHGKDAMACHLLNDPAFEPFPKRYPTGTIKNVTSS